MKKIFVFSLFGIFGISPCFSVVDIKLTGHGIHEDYKIAKYLATKEIEEQFKNLPENSLRFYEKLHEETKHYNEFHITYTDTMVCNFTIQGQEITGVPLFFKQKATELLDCVEEEFKNNELTMYCFISDETLSQIKNILKNQVSFDEEFCENHFENTFEKKWGNTTVQKGIIFGNISFKDYYDNGGKFFIINKDGDDFYLGGISRQDFEKIKHKYK